MNLSLLQLNMNADNYWDNLVTFLTTNDFDIIQLQEVCSKDMICGNINCRHDCYAKLQKILAPKYASALSISQRYASSPQAFMGNATFYKKIFSLKQQMSLPLFENPVPIPATQKSFENVGRTLLQLDLHIEGRDISFLNTHLAWARTTKEQPHQTQQGEKFLSYLQTIRKPFVLSGDFNLDPEQPLIHKISKFGENLIHNYNIVNTLNPRTHRAQVLFPPGAAVDYIVVTPDLKVNKFEVLDKEDLSDHLTLTAEIEF